VSLLGTRRPILLQPVDPRRLGHRPTTPQGIIKKMPKSDSKARHRFFRFQLDLSQCRKDFGEIGLSVARTDGSSFLREGRLILDGFPYFDGVCKYVSRMLGDKIASCDISQLYYRGVHSVDLSVREATGCSQ
jgi:hypothetical protein